MSEPQSNYVSCPVVVLRIEPSQIMGDTMADALRDELLALRRQVGARHVVIDFQSVTYMSSAGFRPLLSLLRDVRASGGRLMLCNLHPDVREVFSVTRLISPNHSSPAAFEARADVAEAIANLDLSTPPPGPRPGNGPGNGPSLTSPRPEA
jgi:anti-anti-sigma factor